jgi:hypothetical protein
MFILFLRIFVLVWFGFGSTAGRTQGLALARQGLYHMSHTQPSGFELHVSGMTLRVYPFGLVAVSELRFLFVLEQSGHLPYFLFLFPEIFLGLRSECKSCHFPNGSPLISTLLHPVPCK